VSVIWKSFGVAVVVAAAELGVSDAVGITRWRNPSPQSSTGFWDATSLHWLATLRY